MIVVIIYLQIEEQLETINDINNNPPKYIVILKYQVNNELVDGVTNNIKGKYKEVQQNEKCTLYEREY